MKITLLLARLAWKNIWRNPFRSLLILMAITIGLYAGTFTIAFIAGWSQATIEAEISNQLSHAQIHTERFNYNSDISAYFQRADVAPVVDSIAGKENTSYRLKLFGTLATAAHTGGVIVKGVEPEQEKLVSDLYTTISDSAGNFLENEKLPIVISQRLAKKLNAKLNSKVVLSVQDMEGEMKNMAFRVCGIYKTNNSMFDNSNVFVRDSDIREATGIPEGAYHEIGVISTNLKQGAQVTKALKAALPGLEVHGWDELQPALDLVNAWTEVINAIILSIFLVALSFGIVNTMLMAVLERTKELGVLACIGMNKRNIFKMIMFETLFLTFLGSLIGILLAWWTAQYTGTHGIDLKFLLGVSYEQFGRSSVVYPVLNVSAFIQIIALVFAVGIATAIYPACKALKVNSIEATKN